MIISCCTKGIIPGKCTSGQLNRPTQTTSVQAEGCGFREMEIRRRGCFVNGAT